MQKLTSNSQMDISQFQQYLAGGIHDLEAENSLHPTHTQRRSNQILPSSGHVYCTISPCNYLSNLIPAAVMYLHYQQYHPFALCMKNPPMPSRDRALFVSILDADDKDMEEDINYLKAAIDTAFPAMLCPFCNKP